MIIQKLVSKLHYVIFGDEISNQMIIFLKKLTWLFLGTLIAKILLFAIQILGGRILQPKIYGEYNLIVTIASFFILPMLFFSSTTALIKFIPGLKSNYLKKQMITTSWKSMLLSVFIFTGFYFLLLFLDNSFFEFFKLNKYMVFLAIIASFIWSFYSYFQNVLISLNNAKTLSLATLISHIITFTIFVIFFKLIDNLYLLYLPIFLGYISFVLLVYNKIKYYFSGKFIKKTSNKLINYNKYIFFASLVSAFAASLDKLILNYFLGGVSVGVYQAYYISSVMVVGSLLAIFRNVFFPTINQLPDVKLVFLKINKLFFPLLIITLLILPIQLYILIRYLYLYPIYPMVIIGFVLFAFTTSISGIYGTILMSIKDSLKYYTKIVLLTAILNIVLNIILIPKYFLTGALLATNISFLIQMLLFIFKLSKIV